MIATTRLSLDVLSRAAAVIRCLGHPLRLRLLEALESGEKTVSELQEYAGASQPTVSQHLMVLKAHGVVDLRRAGPFAYYWIVEPKVKSILECIRAGECGSPSHEGGGTDVERDANETGAGELPGLRHPQPN